MPKNSSITVIKLKQMLIICLIVIIGLILFILGVLTAAVSLFLLYVSITQITKVPFNVGYDMILMIFISIFTIVLVSVPLIMKGLKAWRGVLVIILNHRKRMYKTARFLPHIIKLFPK